MKTSRIETLEEAQQRITDLEREGKLKDERIAELKDEVDVMREQLRAMEEHIQERDEYLEHFIETFGLVLNEDGKWTNSEALRQEREVAERNIELIRDYNKLVRSYNRHTADMRPVGRPLAASEDQQAQILRHHKAGRSSRWIAEEMSLSRRTVTTVINKADGTDRGTQARRVKLGLLPKPKKDWRMRSREGLGKRATEHLEKGRKLRQQAKGLR
jgi:hypothetical protein